jgi:hypothetical protein
MTTVVIHPPATEAPLLRGRARWAAASLLVIGAGLQVAEFLLENPPESNTVRVAQWVADPGRVAASMSVGLLAVPFLLAGFLVLVAVVRQHSRRLAIAAGGLLILAMVGLAGVHGFEMGAFSLATSGQPAAAVAMLDVAQPVAPLLVLMGLFLGGAVLGTLVLAVAMWRSPLLPRVAAVGVVAFAVVDFAVGSPLVSHLLAFANSFVLAWAVGSGYSRQPARGAH